MSWITLTSDDVLTRLAGPEKAALSSAAIAAGQADPLPQVINQVIREARGYVAAGGITLGLDGTVPDELEAAALNRIRFEIASRLPTTAFMNEDRRKQNENALALFRDVAAGRFRIVPPTSAATDQASLISPSFSARKRKFGACDEDGL